MRLRFEISIWPNFLFFLLSLGILFTRRVVAILNNSRHHLSDLYTNALRRDFNYCMHGIEEYNLKFHSCQGFSSVEDCRCSFLKEVDHQCKSLGQTSNNYWHFEHQIQSNCKIGHKVDFSLVLDSKNIENADFKYYNELGFNASATYQTDISTARIPPEYKRNSPDITKANNMHNSIDMSDELAKRNDDTVDVVDFKEYYEKKKPNAMTINCNLMRSLKVTAFPTNHQMTQFSTAILVQNPTETHTTSIEAIMVLPKKKENYQEKKIDKRSNITGNVSTAFEDASVVYLSDASFFSQELPLILLMTSALISVIFVSSYT